MHAKFRFMTFKELGISCATHLFLWQLAVLNVTKKFKCNVGSLRE